MSESTIQHPVMAGDSVSDVLARDESLVDVFVRYAPHFEKLRTRALRRVMARLVTIEQAARIANVPANQLVRDLNAALGLADVPDTGVTPDGATGEGPLRHPANAPVVELDVREDLRAGREPFSAIMAAVANLRDGEILRLRTIFEPAPLFEVLAKRGFRHEAEAHAPDDWSSWFWRPAAPASSEHQPGHETVAKAFADDPSHIVLDVRGLEPPEPLMRTLAALESLPPGKTLVQVNARVPQLLFPMLAERGFACEVDESRADVVIVSIWRAP